MLKVLNGLRSSNGAPADDAEAPHAGEGGERASGTANGTANGQQASELDQLFGEAQEQNGEAQAGPANGARPEPEEELEDLFETPTNGTSTEDAGETEEEDANWRALRQALTARKQQETEPKAPAAPEGGASDSIFEDVPSVLGLGPAQDTPEAPAPEDIELPKDADVGDADVADVGAHPKGTSFRAQRAAPEPPDAPGGASPPDTEPPAALEDDAPPANDSAANDSAANDSTPSQPARLSWLVDYMNEAPTEAPAQAKAVLEAPPEAEDEPTAPDAEAEAPSPPDTKGEPPEDDALSPEALEARLHTDTQADDDTDPPPAPPSEEASVWVDDEVEALRDSLSSGDGYLEERPVPSTNGHAPDAGEDTEHDVGADPRVRPDPAEPETPPPPETEPAAEEPAAPEDVVFEDTDAEAARLDAVQAGDRVVAFLLRSAAVTAEQVQAARARREESDDKESLWRVLAQQDGVEREAVYAGAARVYAFPIADLGEAPPNVDFTRTVMDTFPEERRDELIKMGVAPLRAVRERGAIVLHFVSDDPTRPAVHRLLRRLGVENHSLHYAPESDVRSLLAEAFPRKNEYLERMEGEGMALDLGTNYQEEDSLIDEEALEAEISRSKLINLFEAALVEGVRQGASDIHIYPNAQKQVEIHFRVDGRLHPWHTEDKIHPEAFLAVVKDNSMNVDRFERDAAQDGFIQRWVDDALIRFRVSVMPIANASQDLRSESIVIRILDDRKVITDLSKLGLLEDALERFEHAISQPHGMVILTGPTGSGKSTTLVASLHGVVTPEVNVLTVEDPVEYIIPGVRQIKLNHKLNLEGALRSILRHDPDVVMVGEMRDRATAELAIKLANTGHLTFSTLHTNDAPSAISRLYKMNVEPFLIAYAINLVVAQRLIRRLCPACKQADPDPDPVMLKKMGFTDEDIETTTFYTRHRDKRCKTCHGFGYKGRRAVAEALYFSRNIRHMIVEADRMIDEGAIRDQAVKEGMLTLQDSAREVVKMGETSVREMIRVVTSEA